MTRFNDIIGNNLAKQALFESCVLPMTLCPSQLHALMVGIRGGVGNVILYGAPGTGKTLLAQAVANESGAVLMSLRPSDILSKYQGDSERYLRDTFEAARKAKRAIIFFDEFDSIAIARSGSSSEEGNSRRLLSELLIQLTHNKQINTTAAVDSEGTNQVVVIAATNRIEDLDEAILRRFENKIYVGLPSCAERIDMVMQFMKEIALQLSVNQLNEVARMTEHWSGSEIESLCREAAMIPLRAILPYSATVPRDLDLNIRAVTFEDFGIKIILAVETLFNNLYI